MSRASFGRWAASSQARECRTSRTLAPQVSYEKRGTLTEPRTTRTKNPEKALWSARSWGKPRDRGAQADYAARVGARRWRSAARSSVCTTLSG